MSETNLTAALAQINKLQTELIETEQLVKDALQDYIPENLEGVLNSLIGGSIPNLLLEIGHILKKADFQNFSEGEGEEQIQNGIYPSISMDIKDEIMTTLNCDDDDEEEMLFRDFQIIPDGYQGFKEETNSEEDVEASGNSFIIEGANYEERSKSQAAFVTLCLQVPGSRDMLNKHKGPDKCYLCPHCANVNAPGAKTTKVFNSPKATRFMRHLLQFHEDSPLIPLPFVKRGKQTAATSKNEEDTANQSWSMMMANERWPIKGGQSKAAAVPTEIPNLTQNSDGHYLLTADTSEEKEKKISLFVSLCLKIQGVSEGLLQHKNPGTGTFSCPHCPRPPSLTRPWKFMRHLVRCHEESELIPLPFIRSKEGVGITGGGQWTIPPIPRFTLLPEVDPLATAAARQQPPPSEDTPFVISDEKSLYEFLSHCNKFPGVQDHLKRMVSTEPAPGQPRTYVCPHCAPGKPSNFQKTRDFMRHVVRRHPTSEFIPLPFVREKYKNTRKRKRGMKSEASASSVERQDMEEEDISPEGDEIKLEDEEQEITFEEENLENEALNPEISINMGSESEFILGLN